MPEPTLHVVACRRLLQEVCAVLAPFQDDAVLIGGWVPEILYPAAVPGHVGSVDIDFAMRASRARHQQLLEILAAHGFRPGGESYQFIKNIDVDGTSIPVKLDLLTSPRHHAETFAGAPAAPLPAAGTDFAFTSNTVESVGTTEVRVASVVPLIIMKAYAMLERTKAKDAYDLNFCLENFPGGISALAQEFVGVIDDPAVQDVLCRFAEKFRDEEDSGPRHVVEVEGQMGDSRAIRKFAVYTRVDDFLRALNVRR